MTRQPRQNFGDVRALLFHRPDRNRDVLAETLGRLGLQVGFLGPEGEETAASNAVWKADILFFDADLRLGQVRGLFLPDPSGSGPPREHGRPEVHSRRVRVEGVSCLAGCKVKG